MVYRIEVTPRAARDLRRLAPDVQMRLRAHIRELAAEPRPAGVTKLAGSDDLYRLRVGDFRVIYQVRDDALLVLVVRAGHRRDVYRHLPE